MKKVVSTVALLAIAGNLLMAGGDIAPVEPKVTIPVKETVVIDNVKYDGFYAGGALSHLRMNENGISSGYALTILAGYYFNKYFGIEGRYTRTIGDVDVDNGPTTVSQSDVLSNVGIYLKPMYNVTTGFSIYALAGYGKSNYENSAKNIDASESGVQWGLGAKYELAGGLGFFVDYLNMYSDDNYDGIVAEDILFNAMTVGATYTF
ncbi:putative outer membrane protein A [hydrothermal vent metagenome]|uniref:Putative outer membrane protein A n=1 Tax=hydrothermal vent metagenome TaxID=652676 RepID=A0A1W1CAH4_9ZZZZ